MACDYSISIDYSIELMTCEELHAILHLVLQAGNIMNAVSLSLSPAFFLFIVFPVFPILYPSSVPFFCGHFPLVFYSPLLFPFNYSSPKHSLTFLNQEGLLAFTALMTLTDVLCVFIGWLCRQCCGLQTVLASLSG